MKRLIKPATWTAVVALALVLVGTVAARRRTPLASAAPPAPEVSVLTVVPETVAALRVCGAGRRFALGRGSFASHRGDRRAALRRGHRRREGDLAVSHRPDHVRGCIP